MKKLSVAFIICVILFPVMKAWAVPDLPTNAWVEVIETTGGLRVFWEDVATETGYKIYRTKNPSDNYQMIAELAADSTNYIDESGLSLDTVYYYALEAFDAGGSDGAVGLEARTPPLAVSFVSEDMPNKQGQIRLSWNVYDSTVAYNVYVETFIYSNEGSITPLTNLEGGQNSFVISELSGGSPLIDGVPYYVCVTPVRTWNGVDIENKSAIGAQTVSLDDEAPPAVTNIQFDKEIDAWASIDLSWEESSAADIMEYRVYYSDSPFSSVAGATFITNTTNTDLRVYTGNSSPYYYAVAPVDSHTNVGNYLTSFSETCAPVTHFLNPLNDIVYAAESVSLEVEFDSSDISSAVFQYKKADEALWYTIITMAYSYQYDWVITNLDPNELYSVRVYGIDDAANIEGDFDGNKILDENEGMNFEIKNLYYDNAPPEFELMINRPYTNILGNVDLFISNYSADITNMKYYFSTNGADYHYIATRLGSEDHYLFEDFNVTSLIGRNIQFMGVAIDRAGNPATNYSAWYYADPTVASIESVDLSIDSGESKLKNGDSLTINFDMTGVYYTIDLSGLGEPEIVTDGIPDGGNVEYSVELHRLPDTPGAEIVINVYDGRDVSVSETVTVEIDLIRQITEMDAYTKIEDGTVEISFNSGAEPENLNLYFYNLSGNMILEKTIDDFTRANENYRIQVDPSGLGRGVYLYMIKAEFADGSVQQESGKVIVVN